MADYDGRPGVAAAPEGGRGFGGEDGRTRGQGEPALGAGKVKTEASRMARAPSVARSEASQNSWSASGHGETFELDDFLERDEAYRQLMNISGVASESAASRAAFAAFQAAFRWSASARRSRLRAAADAAALASSRAATRAAATKRRT